MSIIIIGKKKLGEKGFCQNPSIMERDFEKSLDSIISCLPEDMQSKKIVMTSMTGSYEIKETNGSYFPKIRKYDSNIAEMFSPTAIYEYCKKGEDKYRPGCDFIVWDSNIHDIVVTTFSREAPIIAFESENGYKALGTILRPSFMKYGDYLFSTVKESLGLTTRAILVTANYFNYPEGSIPAIFKELAIKHEVSFSFGIDSEKDSDCYHRGEKGNHVVAMW